MGYMLKSKNMQLKMGVEYYTGKYGSSLFLPVSTQVIIKMEMNGVRRWAEN